MKNVTISLDEEVARWARVAAAEREMSLSKFLSELLRARMTDEKAYQAAMREYLGLRRTGEMRGRALPSREEIHDRAALRR